MRTAIALLLALGLGAACAACGGQARSQTVTIMVPWDKTTGEYKAFAAVMAEFEHETGIQVRPEVTRAVAQQLDADLSAGNPPDLVDLPSPGAVEQYEAEDRLKPLTVDLSSYDQPWRGLAESAKGTVYAVPVKADVKSLIWYDTSAVTSPPASWKALENLSGHGTPWCLGLASGSASGWPAADWVADLLLSRYQAGDYERWLAGRLPWTSSEVKNAWQAWGALMRYGAAVYGGVHGALFTGFNQAAQRMAAGRCQFEHGALSATGLTSTAGYDYVVLPSQSGPAAPVMVSGDFMGLFTGNQAARRFLAYLASDQAQTLWVRQAGGHAFSADSAVPPSAYPAGAQQKIAALLQPSAGTALCFAAGDMMVPDLSTAFQQAALEYINDRSTLPDLLAGLQKTQRGAGSSPGAKLACAQP
ncbi:MAG TPA: ABC transporter substrate-binding protein [Streptosporangiaceae bacterium]|nr:ABC transporter substrate-binding protein [Streptosporangiaceae bacterium]HEX5289334.1 ABC transporter substrate-binding protein [Streptosporangiaceae bacterium]